MKRVLIACEESQTACIAFRNRGFEAYSCDIQPCSGGHPEWHIQGDVIPLLAENWDLIIAHPPCTYLTCAGNRYFNVEKYGNKAVERYFKRDEAFLFFLYFLKVDCPHIAVENPQGYPNTHYRKPDQTIHPYMFGEPWRKRTCLWLKGLPILKPTNIIEPTGYWIENYKCNCPKQDAKTRSKSFKGIAEAMAEQWGDYILDN